jgi:uridine phosphorylase
MSNHARGLWGYSGQTADGNDLTVQSTGIGGPSAAVVLHDLAELGLRRAVRVGTCRAGEPGLTLADVLVVEEAVAADPLRGLLREDEAVRPEPALLVALGGAGRGARVRSGDMAAALFGDQPPAATAHDLQTAALLALAARLGIAAAALLVVAETAAGEQIDDKRLEEAAKRAGRAAATALSG